MASNLYFLFKSYGNFAEWVDLAYWWSCIGKGLRLQPAGLFHQDIQTSKNIFVQSNSNLEWWIANVLKLPQGLLIRLHCIVLLSEGLNHIIRQNLSFVTCGYFYFLLCPPLFRTIKKRQIRYETQKKSINSISNTKIRQICWPKFSL